MSKPIYGNTVGGGGGGIPKGYVPVVSEEDDGKIIEIVDGAYVLNEIASSGIGTYVRTVVESSLDEIDKIIGGDDVVLVTKTIDENGTYNPVDDGADAYSSVTVNVEGEEVPEYTGEVVVE